MSHPVCLKAVTTIKYLYFFIVGGYCTISYSVYAETEFEEAFLRRGKNGVTPDVFYYRNAISPGVKTVDIRVNDRFAQRMEVPFLSNADKAVMPCLTREQFQALGVKTSLYDGWQRPGKADLPLSLTDCDNITAIIPAASLSYEDARQELMITVPQEAIDSQRYSMISPQEWDSGVPSLRTSYNGYYYSSHQKSRSVDGWHVPSTTSDSTWLNFTTTGSLGAWRFHSIDSLYRNPGQGWKSENNRSYLSRDIAFLRSQFQGGDIFTHTSGYMMGAVPLSGVSLATRDRMSLDNQFSYAPVIRGTARTNARLLVRQRGNIVYSTTLTPGPFAIDDLYSAQVGADLEVTVEESDGQIQRFRVPYTALPNMIRPGALRYSLASGQYRSQNHLAREPWVTSGSLEYGFEHVTFNSSFLASPGYQSLSTGLAWNVGPIGAFSAEVAHARHQESWGEGETRNGSAARLLYARHFDATGTSLQILGYQYRSSDFLEFQEFNARQSRTSIDGFYPYDAEWSRRKRSRVEMNLNQNMQGYGSLYLALSQERYYGSDHKSTSISGGTGTTLGDATLSLSLTRTQERLRDDNQVSLSVSMPLGGRNERSQRFGSLSYSLNRDRDNRYSQSLGYSGTHPDSGWNYSANVQRNTQGQYSQSGNLGYSGASGSITGGVSRGEGYRQYSAGMSGGVTLYQGGAILSPVMGDTVAIIETPGASGIGISSSNTLRTDYFGRAVVTNLTPYRYNSITLDTRQNERVELKESSRRVVPTEGAAVLLRFATRVGRRAIVEIAGSHAIPLGAPVYIEGDKDEAGLVGDKGIAYLSGLDARTDQSLRIVWGASQAEQCRFTLPALAESQVEQEWYHRQRVVCR